MGISLAPGGTDINEEVDPKGKAKITPPAGTPNPGIIGQVQSGGGTNTSAIGLAPAPQAPGQAGGMAPMTPPAMTAPGGVPAPTVAAPAAPVDRVKLATDVFNQSAASTQGAYDAASRDNIHNSAALGQTASGGLRTREGNLQLARGRDLDLLRQKLVNDATTGSIADATTAYQQQLAGSQQGLAEKIGLAGIDTEKGSLDLEKQKLDVGSGQTQQQIDLAKQAQEQGFGLETEKLAIAKNAQDISNKVALGQLSIAEATQQLDEKVRTGQLTLAERNQALAELSQKQNQGNEEQKIQLAKDQLKQTGDQFGLSLAQQKELATLADKTANRSLDISSAQGKESLLLELARIMGAKDLSSIDPNFLAAIAKSLGVSLPTGGGTTGGGTSGGGSTVTGDGRTGTGGTGTKVTV